MLDLSLKATVKVRGAVLLGKYVACDAFDKTMPLRVVTHAHAARAVKPGAVKKLQEGIRSLVLCAGLGATRGRERMLH